MALPTAQAHPTSSSGLARTRQPDGLAAIALIDGWTEGTNLGRVDLVQGVPVVRLIGELDLVTRPFLQRLLDSVVASPAHTVVIDTSGVTFIDCAGLHPLLQAAVDLQRRRAFLLMLRPSAVVLRLAALTGTSELLDLTYASASARA